MADWILQGYSDLVPISDGASHSNLKGYHSLTIQALWIVWREKKTRSSGISGSRPNGSWTNYTTKLCYGWLAVSCQWAPAMIRVFTFQTNKLHHCTHLYHTFATKNELGATPCIYIYLLVLASQQRTQDNPRGFHKRVWDFLWNPRVPATPRSWMERISLACLQEVLHRRATRSGM